MLGRRVVVGAVAAAFGLLGVSAGYAASPPSPGSGTHGCVLGDVNGTPAPTVYPNSGTSQIGGNSCTVTAVGTASPPGGGEGYVASAQTWSVMACTPQPDGSCTADVSYGSAGGSPPVGTQDAIPAGDLVTAMVHNGTLIVGTPNGVAGA